MARISRKRRKVTVRCYKGLCEDMVLDFSKRYEGLDWEINQPNVPGQNPILAMVEEARAPFTTWAISPIRLRYLPQFVKRGWLRSLDPLFPPSKRDRYAAIAQELTIFDNSMYAAPDDLHPYVLFARRDLLRKHGLPVPYTWGELERQLRFWKERGRSNPLLIRESSPANCVGFLLALLGSNGIDFSLGVEQVLRQRERLIEAYEWLRRLVLRRLLKFPLVSGQEPTPTQSDRYAAGELVYLFLWPHGIKGFQTKLANNTAMVPFPKGPSKGNTFLPVEGSAWCVLHNTASLDVALELLQHITSHSSVRALELFEGCLFPATRALWKDPKLLKKNPLYGEADSLLNAATPCSVDPATPDWSQFYARFLGALKKGKSGKEFVEEVSLETDRYVSRSITSQILRNAVAYIDENLTEVNSVAQLARHVGRHPDYLNRLFKKHMKTNCKAYILKRKLGRAKAMLGDVTLSIKEIALSLGFGSASVFSRTFSKHCGCTPIQMRRRSIDADRIEAEELWSADKARYR